MGGGRSRQAVPNHKCSSSVSHKSQQGCKTAPVSPEPGAMVLSLMNKHRRPLHTERVALGAVLLGSLLSKAPQSRGGPPRRCLPGGRAPKSGSALKQIDFVK